MKSQRLITVDVKKGIFGIKKTEACITETRILNSKKEELSYKSQKVQQLYDTGNRAQMQSYMNDYRMWMTMIMNMVMFSSMMSFMGMAMNPAECAQTDGQVSDSTAADATGGDTTAANTGASDAGDVGG